VPGKRERYLSESNPSFRTTAQNEQVSTCNTVSNTKHTCEQQWHPSDTAHGAAHPPTNRTNPAQPSQRRRVQYFLNIFRVDLHFQQLDLRWPDSQFSGENSEPMHDISRMHTDQVDNFERTDDFESCEVSGSTGTIGHQRNCLNWKAGHAIWN
jgi:hypothetical protein